MTKDSEKYWYNLSTGEVEKGFESPAIDRAGPFETAEEAAKAPALLRERSKAWAEEESRDDDWSSSTPKSSADGTDGDN
ncbi:MAG: SPOR domain-containing protein [Microbacterium pygmaeum]